MKTLIVKKEDILRDFLSEKLNLSKNKSKELIDSRNVFVNNRRIWIAAYKLKKNDYVEIHPDYYPKDKGKNIQLKIIYEDQYILAIDKPSGILTSGSNNSLETQLKVKLDNNIKAIHRLDKDTTGTVIFAKSHEVFEKFKEIWQDKKVIKEYLAISLNEAEFQSLTIDNYLDGKRALSHIKLLSKNIECSYFEIKIETGRKHQIRLHLASIRHPILGDKVYGMKSITSERFKKIKRQMLHSYKISYICPYTQNTIVIKAPLPKDFVNVLNELNLYNTKQAE